MTLPLTSTTVRLKADPQADTISLSYEDRLVRRKRLVSDQGVSFIVDLPNVISLSEGDAFELSDGQLISVRAAEEALIEIKGPLVKLAWHIGNRHTPCQIEADRILIAHNHVIEDMLRTLGAELRHVTAPFTPEGGAYGIGRTFGHSHD